jgi:hypothetical protein
LTLPLGSPAQRKIALAGLRSGEWGEIRKIGENTYGWVSQVDVDADMLGLFAVRVGVDARRAAGVLPRPDGTASDELLVSVLAERGSRFAQGFIQHACVARRRIWEHSTSVFGPVAVSLVDRLDLPAPENVEYLKDWAALAAAALGLKAELRQGQAAPDPADIQPRFAEHVRVGLTAGAPATGPFGQVVPEGVARGWFDRDEAVELLFAALDAAGRPGDRKAWLGALDQLGVSDAEFLARLDGLAPLLATGDAFVVERIAPPLIAGADDAGLVEVLTAALTATTKKSVRLVLEAALARPRPAQADDLAAQLGALAAGRDQLIARLAAKLVAAWSLDAPACQPASAGLRGMWRQTPPVWTAPRFAQGAATPETLTGLAAELTRRAAACSDVVSERFLAVANAVARDDPAGARTALRGVRPGADGVLALVPGWRSGEWPDHTPGQDRADTIFNPLPARDSAVFQRLGQVPSLLSTPSLDDLSILLPDLVARLEEYAEVRATASEADLFLALTRLDLASGGQAATARLAELAVPVLSQSGQTLGLTAGRAVAQWLDAPALEPGLERYDRWQDWWVAGRIEIPDWLRVFPDRLSHQKPWASVDFMTFPSWGDAGYLRIGWSSDVQREQGLVLRQVARRSGPLPPGMAINLLAAQRSMPPVAAADSQLAVIEAWERGLLRPGVADVAFLDWHSRPPGNLAALVAALVGIGREGLLSVVWPLLDDLIAASLKAPRMVAGTAEAAQAMVDLLPEAAAAVASGLAPPSVLDLPGLRALAARPGSSLAVSAARRVAARLPPLTGAAAPAAAAAAAPVLDPPFDQVWPTDAGAAAPILDSVEVSVDWLDPEQPSPVFLFTLVSPGQPGRRYAICKSTWHYDLEREGQCEAWEWPWDAEARPALNRPTAVWLHWDAQLRSLVSAPQRDWANGTDGPFKGVKPPLSQALVTVVVGLLAQDASKYAAPHLVRQGLNERTLGWAAVRDAARALLASPVVSPAKLVRHLEKDPHLLPVLWPLLTEPVRAAAQVAAKPPTWANRVLDVALRHAPYLAEATHRGLIPADAARWGGLAALAASPAKSAGVAKARRLAATLGLNQAGARQVEN